MSRALRFRGDRLAAWLIAVIGSGLAWKLGLKRLSGRWGGGAGTAR